MKQKRLKAMFKGLEMTRGATIVRNLKEFADAISTGKPIRQTIVRRMKVKGKTVYVQEKVKAPIRL